MGVGEGSSCGWTAVRNAMMHPTDKHKSHSNIDRPTDRQAWEMGAVVGRQVGWGNNKMQLFLLSFVRNALGAVRLQTINDTFLIPAIALASHSPSATD